ncbi:MAG: hypothetical protein ISEC1_P0254 [Thiomicrorhabdus sp.]|nr:MAG: hypothetical protein ISEC1_P0254 [Thiomicrorhabdus sp.]
MHHIQPTNKTMHHTLNGIIISTLLIATTLFSNPLMAKPQGDVIDNELQTHIDLVENALRTDSYNKRCRGMSVSKALNQVNRLLVTKYSLTANNFIKTFMDRDVRGLKSARQHTFNKNLNLMGGCTVAKSEGIVEQLKIDFKSLYEQAEKSPWYPE